MKPRYTVRLVSSVTKAETVYGKGYFPHHFAYKADAERLRDAVIRMGGNAVIAPHRQARPIRYSEIRR